MSFNTSALPVAIIGVAGDSNNGDEGTNYTSGTAIAYMVAYALGTSIGATIGWHLRKHERSVWSRLDTPPPLSGADDQRWPELRWRPVRGARVAPTVGVPLLVFAF
jgi:hypothetical protein